jgi:hypothetical protein
MNCGLPLPLFILRVLGFNSDSSECDFVSRDFSGSGFCSVFIILGVFPSECVYVCQDFSRFSGN